MLLQKMRFDQLSLKTVIGLLENLRQKLDTTKRCVLKETTNSGRPLHKGRLFHVYINVWDLCQTIAQLIQCPWQLYPHFTWELYICQLFYVMFLNIDIAYSIWTEHACIHSVAQTNQGLILAYTSFMGLACFCFGQILSFCGLLARWMHVY